MVMIRLHSDLMCPVKASQRIRHSISTLRFLDGCKHGDPVLDLGHLGMHTYRSTRSGMNFPLKTEQSMSSGTDTVQNAEHLKI